MSTSVLPEFLSRMYCIISIISGIELGLGQIPINDLGFNMNTCTIVHHTKEFYVFIKHIIIFHPNLQHAIDRVTPNYNILWGFVEPRTCRLLWNLMYL